MNDTHEMQIGVDRGHDEGDRSTVVLRIGKECHVIPDPFASQIIPLVLPAKPGVEGDRKALEIALKALRTLHRNGISDDIAGTALNDIQDVIDAPPTNCAGVMKEEQIVKIAAKAVMADPDAMLFWSQIQDIVRALNKAGVLLCVGEGK